MKTVFELLNPVPFSPLVIVFAFALDLMAGDPERFPHPVRWMGRLAAFAEGELRGRLPKTRAGERLGGALLWVIVVGLSYSLTLAVLYLAYEISPTLSLVIAVYFVWAGLSIKSLGDEAASVVRALEKGLPEARARLARIVGRDTANLKEEGVLKAAVETVAENASDGVVAPLFFLALGGPPLMMAYKAVNTLDSMVGYRNDRYRNFGWFPARADDAANFIPARITGGLIVSASFILGYNWVKSAYILKRDRKKHPSPNAGAPEAAMAGALGVQMGGPTCYGGVLSAKPVIGDMFAAYSPESVLSSIRIMRSAAALMILGVFMVRTLFIYFL